MSPPRGARHEGTGLAPGGNNCRLPHIVAALRKPENLEQSAEKVVVTWTYRPSAKPVEGFLIVGDAAGQISRRPTLGEIFEGILRAGDKLESVADTFLRRGDENRHVARLASAAKGDFAF